jgi:uncharacterized repeat protein (TIGR03837 family)
LESERWDVFCRVVDNFGDVGVSWRLARLLACEHGKGVRLWLDDPAVLARLRPELDPEAESQALEGVQVVPHARVVYQGRRRRRRRRDLRLRSPEAYVLAMAAREPRPRWINLEYLSAEEWVEGSHALAVAASAPAAHQALLLSRIHAAHGRAPSRSRLDRAPRRIPGEPGAQAAFWTSLTGAVPPAGR